MDEKNLRYTLRVDRNYFKNFDMLLSLKVGQQIKKMNSL